MTKNSLSVISFPREADYGFPVWFFGGKYYEKEEFDRTRDRRRHYIGDSCLFFIQEANFQKEAAEQNLHGFEAFSLIPAMGILVVFLEIFFGVLVIRFVYAMVVLIIKATKEQRELDRDFLQQTK